MATEVIGIDPGKDGAISRLGVDGATVTDMPTIEIRDGKSKKREIDRKRLLELLRGTGEVYAVVEKQQAYPGQGSVSNYSTGFGYAVILTALDALGIPYEEVHPKTWQKHYGIKGATKGMSCAVAEKLFPQASIRGPRGRALDGRADALLLAEYGRRRIGGLQPQEKTA